MEAVELASERSFPVMRVVARFVLWYTLRKIGVT